MQELKKINVLSMAKVFVLFGILMGLLMGLNYGLASMNEPLTFDDAAAIAEVSPEQAFTAYMIALGWTNLLVLPILLGIFYFISGSVVALLYNLFSKKVGGIKVDLVDVKKASKKK